MLAVSTRSRDVGQHRFAGGAEEVGLVFELVVDRALGQAGGGGDLVDGDPLESLLGEQATRLGHEALAVGQRWRA
jgi:hypothetical protein